MPAVVETNQIASLMRRRDALFVVGFYELAEHRRSQTLLPSN